MHLEGWWFGVVPINVRPLCLNDDGAGELDQKSFLEISEEGSGSQRNKGAEHHSSCSYYTHQEKYKFLLEA